MKWSTLFIFILAMNLIGIIPGFESPTMSVYVPAALAVSTWVYYHVMGVRELGFWKYLAHFGGPILALATGMFAPISWPTGRPPIRNCRRLPQLHCTSTPTV